LKGPDSRLTSIRCSRSRRTRVENRSFRTKTDAGLGVHRSTTLPQLPAFQVRIDVIHGTNSG
jgi:hypothetical protein